MTAPYAQSQFSPQKYLANLERLLSSSNGTLIYICTLENKNGICCMEPRKNAVFFSSVYIENSLRVENNNNRLILLYIRLGV